MVTVTDANDVKAIDAAYQSFKDCTDKPTLIILKSIIGWGAPNKQNTSGAHGSPLGDDEIKLAKENYGWPADQKFLVPGEVLEHFKGTLAKRGGQSYEAWAAKYQELSLIHI